jgi:hypothetical protein
MKTIDWKWNEGQQQYVLIVTLCADHEAQQIFKHPAVDSSMTRFYNPHSGRLECWIRKEFAHDLNGIGMVRDWIMEDVLPLYENIQHDWSSYLDSLLV